MHTWAVRVSAKGESEAKWLVLMRQANVGKQAPCMAAAAHRFAQPLSVQTAATVDNAGGPLPKLGASNRALMESYGALRSR